MLLLFPESSIDEVAPAGTRVGELSVEDEDQGQTHTFQLLDDAGGLFKIGDDDTVVKATDERLDVQRVYSIKVKATDSGSTPAEVGLKSGCVLLVFLYIFLCTISCLECLFMLFSVFWGLDGRGREASFPSPL